jgi:hypothetical protein
VGDELVETEIELVGSLGRGREEFSGGDVP